MVFLKFLQISQENTCVEVSFKQSLQDCNLIKKYLQHSFPVEFAKFLKTLILTNISERLLLKPAQISPGLPFFDNLHFWLKLVQMFYFFIII